MRSSVSTLMTVFVLLFWLGSVQAQSNNNQPNSTIPPGTQNTGGVTPPQTLGGVTPPQTIADCCRNLSDRVDALESRIQQLEGGLASVKVNVNQNDTRYRVFFRQSEPIKSPSRSSMDDGLT